MTHRIAATLSLAAFAASATAQAESIATPSAAAAAERLMRALDRVEAAANAAASARREPGAAAPRRSEPDSRPTEEAKEKADAERARRLEQQLDDQRAANAKALHELQQQLAALRESTSARIAAIEQERDAALRRQQQLATGHRELLEAVRTHRQAVDAMIRELEARLQAGGATTPPAGSSPRQ